LPREWHPPIDFGTDAAKAERELETKRAAKARRELDRHRIETGDER